MSTVPISGPPRRYTATVLAAALLTLTGLLLAGTVGRAAFAAPAVDTPASATVAYTCPFPLIGNQVVRIRYDASVPASVTAGDPLTVRSLRAVVTFPDTATQGFALVGASTIDGSAVAPLAVGGGAPATTTTALPIPSTPVPASGPFDASTGAADAAPVTVTQVGTATVSVGSPKLTLTPRRADGSDTGLGTFDSACTPQPDQNTTLAQVLVTPPATVPPSTTTETSTTTSTTPPATTTTPPPTTTTTQPDPVVASVRGGGSMVVGGQRYSIAVDARSTAGAASGRVAISGRDATAGSRTITSVRRDGHTGQVTGTAVRSDGRAVPFRLTVVDRTGGGDQVTLDLGGRVLAGTLSSGDIVVS